MIKRSFASLLPRATALQACFFGYAETAPLPLPALSAEGGFAQRHTGVRSADIVSLTSYGIQLG
jgi:hypothetical protein